VPARRKLVPGAVVVTGVLLAAACSSDAPPRTEATTTTTKAAVASTTTTEPVTVDLTGCRVPRRALPDPRRPRYHLRIDLRPDQGTVGGDQTVAFTPDLPIDRLVFRLWANGPSFGAAGGRIDAGPVTVDGAAIPVERPDPTTLVVPLGRTVEAGTTIVAAMPWTLHLPDNLNNRISRAGDSVRMGSFFPMLGWEPGVGWALEPPTRVSAETFTSPTADFELDITAPADRQVLATGRQVSPTHWSAPAVRDVNVVAGRFRTASADAGPVRVTVAVAQSLPDDPNAFLAPAVAALDDFSTRFGPYPWPSYTIAVTPAMRGGIEYPMLVSAGSGSFGRSTPHEVGHMWFYGLVGNNQARDPWIDEGLASWAEARALDNLPSFVARAIPPDAGGRMTAPMTFWEGRSSYYLGAYVQGAQALAALGEPDRVDCALRIFVARNAHRIATVDDLVRSLEEVFPDARARLAPFGVPARSP
jgi:hypothetical protein